MAQYGSNAIVINFDDSGGTPRDMSNYIRTFNGFELEALMQETHAYGDTWVESSPTGVDKAADITIEGYYDDTASTGPNVVFNAVGNTTTRTLTVTWGSAKTTSGEMRIVKYKRTPVLNELTKFSVTLRPSGVMTDA